MIISRINHFLLNHSFFVTSFLFINNINLDLKITVKTTIKVMIKDHLQTFHTYLYHRLN